MPESKKTSGPKHISDVTHADKTSPSDTSRPVIITNRPILKDPMMSDKPAASEKPAAPVTERLKVADKSKATPQGEKVVEAAKSEIKPGADSDTAPGAVPEAKPAAADKTPPDIPPDVSRGELSKDPEASDDIEASKQAEHETAVQKLIDSKQYYLPIETLEHRRSKRFVALGVVLSLVLALAWVDVALDANLIQLHGIKPVTHFFSN